MMTKKQFERFFWFIPFALFLFQLIFTLNSLNQIRGEEIAESIRSIYWFDDRTIYYGAYTNVGWYAVLSLIYNFFGFGIFTAKYYRLLVSLVSLFSLASVLRKYLGPKKSIIPLVTIGLSPTLLYFNTIMTTYGLDLQYFPIILYLIDGVNPKKRMKAFLRQFSAWSLSMIAWMSYPVFMYYLPVLFGLFVYKSFPPFTLSSSPLNLSFPRRRESIRKLQRGSRFSVELRMTMGLAAALGFLTPFLFAFVWISNKSLLIYDPAVKSGIFRGAGSISFNLGGFYKSIYALFSDLFIHANSYYFELKHTDFADFVPIIPIVAVAVITFIVWSKVRRLRPLILLIIGVLVLNIVISSLSADPSSRPGIRRYTPILAGFYFFFTIAWKYANAREVKLKVQRQILTIALLTLTLHHLFVFPLNASHLKDRSFWWNQSWFNQIGDPAQELSGIVKSIQSTDIGVSCVISSDIKGDFGCKYSDLLAAVMGSCKWNSLNCHRMYVYYEDDPTHVIWLSKDLWDSGGVRK